MAQRALGAGMIVPRKRALFGLLDADGWAWAGVKAFIWLIIIILLLGYIPDRAYYLTVNRTVDLGVLAWSPINLCPPTNESLPCPAPVGAVTPWHESPTELNLPAARTDGSATQLGTKILYIGGTDGTAAQSTVFVAPTSGIGNFDKWAEGPPLPEPRSDASVVQVSGTVYVLGGLDADGAPTTTVFTLTPDPQTGALPDWETAPEALTLPEGRAGAAGVAAPDGRAAHRRRGTRWPGGDDVEEHVRRPGRPAEMGSRGTAPGSAGGRDRRDHRRPRVAVRRA